MVSFRSYGSHPHQVKQRISRRALRVQALRRHCLLDTEVMWFYASILRQQRRLRLWPKPLMFCSWMYGSSTLNGSIFDFQRMLCVYTRTFVQFLCAVVTIHHTGTITARITTAFTTACTYAIDARPRSNNLRIISFTSPSRSIAIVSRRPPCLHPRSSDLSGRDKSILPKLPAPICDSPLDAPSAIAFSDPRAHDKHWNVL